MGTMVYHTNDRKNAIITECQGLTVIDQSIKSNVAYTLVQYNEIKYILVHKITLHDGRIGVKTMDEGMHPYFYDCPIKFLKASTLKEGEAWRTKCLEYHAKKKIKKSIKDTLKYNDKIIMEDGSLVTFKYHYKTTRFAGENSNGETYAYRYNDIKDILKNS